MAVTASCCDLLQLLLGDEEAQEKAVLFRALGDKTRVQILAMLCRYPGEVCVCHLVDALPLEQPTVSYHLNVLKQAGLVKCYKRGTWAYYYPNWDVVRKLQTGLDIFLTQEVKS